eukprot:CAMPEP_0113553890 /NCGR_PEP_ID=MMETSP0015_2-20120614/15853_1 /TAXON_ID=2838 /ORGANISM="Odontella" /LENGTH=556 /DNA_ID=CAMNT_0000454987 /DNA_START=180 /DNA_END=1850 /DNA_ORIENTATION=- /assembly_acc=CAM_ASM_000160
MMVNGFHPQMTALPNPVGPIAIPPLPSSSRRRAPGLSSSSSSSSQRPGSLQMSLSGLIDSRTSTLVNKLRDDVQNEERHRRTMVTKRRRTGYGSSSSYSSSYSSSFSESDTSSRSVASSRSVSSLEASSAATRRGRDKRQRTAYYKEVPRGDSSVANIGGKKTLEAPASFLAGSEQPTLGAPPKYFSSSAPTTAEPCYDSTSPLSSSESDTDQASTKASSTASGLEGAFNDGAGLSDLYSEVFLESEKPQIIATLGGRIVTWNDEFLSSTGLLASQLRGCVTVHNLVEPAMQSRLNDLFELALREGNSDTQPGSGGSNCNVVDPARPPLMVIAPAADGGRGGLRRELRQVPAPRPDGVGAGVGIAEVTSLAPATPDVSSGGHPAGRNKSVTADYSRTAVPGLDAGIGSYGAAATPGSGSSESSGSGGEEDDEEEDGETHLSITLPCRQFRSVTEQLCITIILMNDIDPSKRCYYCILSPPANPPPTISFPAASMTFFTPENHSGGYMPVGNGWYRSLHTGQFLNSMAMPAQMQTPLVSAATGKIRRIGQKQLASLL